MSIIRDPRFEREMAAIESDPLKADEYLEGIDWVLERDPYAGNPVSLAFKVYMLHIARDTEGLKPIAIYYLIEEPNISLIGAFVDEEEEEF